ncbi:GNAT family N-acetyltransferase [Amycolatopsis sp. H20-H5]|uniref:GNAT family N-acetyltransferase n=1 Tax=Amycolatopsis sp. H20-H5 TaxID=3046309 RepID=UPI002DBE8CD0|nr:GNAT family N-acetyltransferase [Amycolatopsis sp. H20-H5]MEC3976618.1 GNAT family N-acetyltransferase [Amycolatopsis sp. H20-H5]
METPAETLTDGEVVLRRWRLDDHEQQARVVGDAAAHLGAWMNWAMNGYGERESREYLERTTRSWDSGEIFDFAISTTGGELAGGCGLTPRTGGGLEIGYWLHPDYTGRGLVTRAARLLTAEALRVGAAHVEIRHDELNVRSAAVPRRLGYTLISRNEPPVLPLAPACGGVDHLWRLERPWGVSGNSVRWAS